jgi:putative transposase
MGSLVFAMIAYVRAFFVPRHRFALEAAALRQQLAVFKRKQPRPRLNRSDRLFWTVLRRLYSGWADFLILVKRKRWCPGIVLAFVCFGGGGLGRVAGRK